jgi:hypothetical protein
MVVRRTSPSWHYCCAAAAAAGNRDYDVAAATGSTADNNEKPPRSAFPCPGGDQATCGACVHRNLQAAGAAAGQQQQPDDPFAGCGGGTGGVVAGAAVPPVPTQIVVFAQFDVETIEPFGWFLPQHFALPLLEAHSSLWILNTRGDANDWAGHVLHWYSTTRRLFHAFDLPYYDNDTASPLLAEEIAAVVAAPTIDLSVDYLQHEFDQSLARAANVTAHDRRHRQLVQVYQQHADHVTQWAQRHNHPLLHINVDGDPATTALALAQAFRFENVTRARQCWKFNPHEYGADWQDFRLPL